MEVCPYKEADKIGAHVFKYLRELVCENVSCFNCVGSEYNHEGDGLPFRICKSDGLVDSAEKEKIVKWMSDEGIDYGLDLENKMHG